MTAPPLATMPKGAGNSRETRLRCLAVGMLHQSGMDWDGLADAGPRVNAVGVLNGAIGIAICAGVLFALYYGTRGLL